MDIGKGLKMIWDFLFGGGLWKLIVGAGSGILRIVKFLLIDAIPMAIGALGNAGKAIVEWATSGVERMKKNFPRVEFPDTGIGDMIAGFMEKLPGIKNALDWAIPGWVPLIPKGLKDTSVRDLLSRLPSIPEILGWVFSKIPGLSGLVEDGKVKGIPAIWQLFNPFFMPGFIKDSFFPAKGSGGKAMAFGDSGSSAPESPDKGDSKSDAIQPNEDKKKDAGSTASSISSSASYDKKGGKGGGGIIPFPIESAQGGSGGGSGGALASHTLNKYEYANAFTKAVMLAKLYKD